MFRDLDGIVACDGSGAVVGTALSWRYGPKAATLGMVLVALALQGRGIGRRLMDNVLEDLEGCALMLSATEAGQRLYKALGFSTIGTFRQQQGTYQPTEWKARKTRARKLLPADRDAVTALDTAAFGAPRIKLLDRLLAEGEAVVIEGANGVAGFAIRRDFGRGRVIGPVIAADEAAAIDLIAALVEPGFLARRHPVRRAAPQRLAHRARARAGRHRHGHGTRRVGPAGAARAPLRPRQPGARLRRCPARRNSGRRRRRDEHGRREEHRNRFKRIMLVKSPRPWAGRWRERL